MKKCLLAWLLPDKAPLSASNLQSCGRVHFDQSASLQGQQHTEWSKLRVGRASYVECCLNEHPCQRSVLESTWTQAVCRTTCYAVHTSVACTGINTQNQVVVATVQASLVVRACIILRYSISTICDHQFKSRQNCCAFSFNICIEDNRRSPVTHPMQMITQKFIAANNKVRCIQVCPQQLKKNYSGSWSQVFLFKGHYQNYLHSSCPTNPFLGIFFFPVIEGNWACFVSHHAKIVTGVFAGLVWRAACPLCLPQKPLLSLGN